MVGVPIALIVGGHNVHGHDVLLGVPRVEEGDAQRREHAAARLGDDHLCAELVEPLPQVVGLQVAFDLVERGVLARARLNGRLGHRAHFVVDWIKRGLRLLLLLSIGTMIMIMIMMMRRVMH